MSKNMIFLISKEKKAPFALCAMFFLPSLNNFANTFIQRGLGIPMELLTPVSYIFMVLLNFWVMVMHKTWKKSLLIWIMVMLGAIALSYIIYPDMRSTIYNNPVDLVYNPINKIIFYCIPAVFCTIHIKDFKSLFLSMVKWSRVTLLAGIITYFYVALIAKQRIQYMVFSYFMLTALCVCFENFRCKRKIADLLLALVGSVTIILCGARGAVLSLVMFLVLRFWIFNDKLSKAVRIVRGLLGACGILLLAEYFQQILSWASWVCETLGVESRIITALLQDELTSSKGRNILIESVWRGIANNPMGYGLFGDRYVAGTFGYDTYKYVHNVFLEMLCDFGVLLGPALIGYWMYTFFKTMRRNVDVSFHSAIWALIPYGIFQLFFSASVLENIAFYAICGFMYAQNMRR